MSRVLRYNLCMDNKTVPQIIKQYRVDHELSQADLTNQINEFYGNVTDLKRQNIGMWENGVSRPNIFLLAGIDMFSEADNPLQRLASDILDIMDAIKEKE